MLLGVYEFSRRRGEPDCRAVVPMGPPDRERAAAAIARLDADGGTPIGQAMITAKRALDETGLARRHLLVVTDGENTDGVAPDRVAAAIGKRPEAERPSIYFVAFDVEANRFSRVRDAGGLVLSAANATELNDTLDTLLQRQDPRREIDTHVGAQPVRPRCSPDRECAAAPRRAEVASATGLIGAATVRHQVAE